MDDNGPTSPDPTTDGVIDVEQQGETLDADRLPDQYPDKPTAAFEHGTTEREMREGESLEDRLEREHPDVGTRAPAPGEPLAVDEDTTATPLMDDAEDGIMDTEGTSVSERPLTEPQLDDSGEPVVDAPAEQAAVRVEDRDDAPGAVDRRPVIQDLEPPE